MNDTIPSTPLRLSALIVPLVLRGITVIAALLSCTIGHAWAASYYVSPSGSDTNTGLSPGSPWKTVAKVNTTTLSPGDRILFSRGGEWRESLNASANGTSASPITYADYGSGAKPKFWGSDILVNSRFEPVSGSIYRYPLTQRPNCMLVDHSMWIRESPGTSTASTFSWDGAYLRVNTGGVDPRTSGRVYTACVREDIIFSNYKHHLVFRNLVAAESANRHAGYAIRVMGSSNVLVEDCEAYHAGRHHIGVINSTGFTGRRLHAAYAMPGIDSTFYVSFSDASQGRSNDTSQYIDCSGDHFENPDSTGRQYQIFWNHGDGLGPILIENMVSRGGILSIGQDRPANTTIIRGGLIENAVLELFASNVLVDGLTVTGSGGIDNNGADNVFQNLKMTGITGRSTMGYDTAILMRGNARRSIVRLSTIVLDASASEAASCLGFLSKGLLTKWHGNIMLGRRRTVRNWAGALDATDADQVNYNFYNSGATFNDIPFPTWRSSFDQSSLTGDPLFVNAAAGDYALRPASPAIDRATLNASLQTVIPVDITGAPRLQGSAFDMGAFEWASGVLGPPAITSAGVASAFNGIGFAYQITATNLPTGYAATGLPAGLAINGLTGVISGTPVSPGTANVTLRASNATGTGTKNLLLTISSDLTGHWRLDETAGTTASDSSGNGHSGVLVNGPVWTPGKIGRALSLDGINDFVRIPDAPGLRSDHFTIALWFRPRDLTGGKVLISKPNGSGSDNSWVLYLSGSSVNFHSNNFTGAMSRSPLSSGVWQHVAVVKDSISLRMYLNGSLVDSATVPVEAVAYTGRSIFLGAEDDNGDDNPEQSYFNGDLDDVRFYVRALSQADIQALIGGDTTGPAVTFTSPANGATVNGSVTVSANATDNIGVAGVQFRLNGVNLGAEDTTAPYSVAWNTAGVANGSHTLTAVARDAAGNIATVTRTVTVQNAIPDTTNPTVTLTSPANGAIVSGSVTVSANATDNIGVAGVQFRLNGVNLGAEDTTAPYSVAWNTAGVANGSHTLTAVARDAAGNIATVTRTVSVQNAIPDTTNPTVTLTSPANGAVVSGSVTVSANATDNIGVAGVQFRLNGVNLGAEDTTAPYSVAWNTAGVANGSHTLTAVARDAAGNIATVTRTVTVQNAIPDTTNPTVTLTSPANGAIVSGSVTVSANATDNIGVAGVQFRLNGMNLGAEDTTAPYSVIWNTTGVTNGSHTLTAIARDVAGNTASSAITVLLAGTAPQPNSPAAHWLLDETGGTSAADSSANNNRGTLVNGAQWSAGRIGGALSFDGQNDFVRVADSPTLRASDFTLSLWLQSTNLTGSQTLISRPVGPNYENSYVLYLVNGQLNFHSCCSTPTLTAGTVLPGLWTHIAVTKSGSLVRLYVNGNEAGSMNAAPAVVQYNTRSLFFGAEDDSGDDVPDHSFFSGKMDDIRFYPRGLTASEIRHLLDGDTTAPAISFSSPAAGSSVAGTITVAASASDNIGVAGVQFRLDGAVLGSEDTSAPWSVSWNTATVTNGVHTLSAIARDAAGNTSTATLNVTVNNPVIDTIPPTVTLTSPLTGETVSGLVTLSATAADNIGVTGVQFRLNGANLGAEDTTPPYSVNWNTAGLTAGTYTLTALARDAAGNSRTSAVATVSLATAVSGSLQAHWRLDETGGTIASDGVGGNNGVLLNGPLWTTGRSGGGLSFDGINDFVRIPDSPALRSNDFTIALWFHATNVTGNRVLIAKPVGPSTDNSYLLYLNNGSIRFRTSSTTGGLFYGPVAAGGWYHVMVSKAGTRTELYLNGRMVFSSTNAPANVAYDNSPLFLGADDDDGDNKGDSLFVGVLDEVHFYNRALATTEMLQLYNAR